MKGLKQKEVRFCEKTTELYILFVTLALSLFCFPYERISEYKFKFFLFGTAIYIVVLLLGNVELALIGRKSDLVSAFRKAKSIPLVAIFLYFAFCLVSFLLSEHKAFAIMGGGKFDGIVPLVLYVLAFASVAIFGKVNKSFFLGLGIVVWVNFIIVLLQVFGANPIFLYPQGLNYYDAFKLYANEFLGTFGNVDILSVFFAMALPIFICSAMNFGGKTKYFFFSAITLSSFLLLICKVYTGLLGAGVAIFIMGATLKEEEKIRVFLCSLFWCSFGVLFALLLTKLISFGAFVLGFVISFVFILAKKMPIKRFSRFFVAFSILFGLIIGYIIIKDSDADSGRLKIWRDAFNMFLEKPLFGIGTGAYFKESSTIFERFDPSLGITIKSAVDCAHNVYLNILVNSGIFALLSYIWLMISIFLYSKNRQFIFPALAYLICALFSFEICSVSAFFYVICGLAVSDNINKL